MVDFKKLRASERQAPATHPVDIFRRLPKPPGINDLYSSQAEVLEAWHARRNERDLVVKLHTGGVKTLVGLLMAQAVLNETREPVIYLAPTVQLVQQVLAKAGEYSIPAVGYEKGVDLRDEFFAAKAVLVCTYQALFHGKSKFGVRGDGKEPVSPAAVLADDAHVAFSTVREQFSLQVKKEKDPNGYAHLTTLFRNDFAALDRVGTFDDVVNGVDYGVLEVPYWSWQAKAGQVREYLRTKAQEHPYQWPFVRDALDHCHCIISRNALVVTPLFPLVDLVPAIIGFSTDRPERNYRVGPDVLWLVTGNSGLVIEAKSRKNAANALKREQHGQLLNAAEWFQETYPDHSCVRVVVHPNVTATKSTVTGQTKALTFDRLQGLISEARTLIAHLCESHPPQEELVRRCEQLLAASSLTPDVLVEHYLVPFQVKEE